MDYLVIGSNGFAQVGDPGYYKKNKVEMSFLLEFIKSKFPLTEEFTVNSYYSIKSFQHDFGTYHELVLWYDENILEEWQNSEDENEQDLFTRFWDWFNEIESTDLESAEISMAIQKRYHETLNTEKREHLNIVRA
jgi:hypothetical protein